MGLFEKKMEILQTYSQLFEIIENESFNSPLLKELQSKIKEPDSASFAVHKLKSHSNNLGQSSNILGLLILNPLVFWNIIFAIKIEKWVLSHQTSISAWFDVLAKFDSLVSFAVFAYTHPTYSYPEVSDSYMLEGKDLGHPMLNRDVCVQNNVAVSKRPYFLVVTGANMAGKSTYLRTIGINLTLACAGAPVCAASLKFYPYKLVTNLRTSDSLTDNESYFFAELKRLKMIIDRLEAGEPLFIILDEILKGTNSEDKQKGSVALMKQLVAMKGNGIIATHDLVLGNLEKEFPDAIKNFRFEADIKDEHLSFTYKIREGVAQNMNASFLMKKMGITGL
jgi:DNA mismatch repair ATPase MutS